MRKFVIVGKTTGAVMLYDTEFGGMAVATFYTVRQLMDMGATVIGVKSNTKQFSCYVMDKNENRSLGNGVPVVGTKRSASTFMKGIKKPVEERKAEKEAEKKKIEAEKERKRAEREAKKRAIEANKERKAREKKEKIARAEEEKRQKAYDSLRKKNAISFHNSKCLCALSRVENEATEYHEKEKEYYTLYAETKAALSNLVKVLQNYCALPAYELGRILPRVREGFKSHGRVSILVPLDMMEFGEGKFYQCVPASSVSLSFVNHYEDYSAEWKFRESNGYKPEFADGRHRYADDTSYGSTANGDSDVNGFASSLRNAKHLRNMPYIPSTSYSSCGWNF